MTETTIMCDEFNKLILPKNKKSVILHGNIELLINNDKYDLADLNDDQKCAPGKKFKDGVCFSLNNLCAMARAYNKSKDTNKITLKQMNNKHEYKKYLLHELNDRLKDICDDYLCWLKQDFINEMENEEKFDLLHRTHRPTGPQGRFTWLDTVNLDQVMKQYELLYPDYKYLGTVPQDFDDLDEKHKLSSVDYNKLMERGKTKYGVIFNLDFHHQAGSHWVALYADMTKGNVVFFDSYGEEPTARITKLMDTLKNVCNGKSDYNKFRHQYKNSECGVYSINFIARMLAGQSLEKISQTRISDDDVNACRQVYFRDVNFDKNK